MKKIIIPFSNTIDTNSCIANIDNFKWCNNDYKPDTNAYLAYDNEKIYIKLISYEKERRAECNADETKICTDSCMEFFVKPFNDD
ncbi:MAG: carbohydrate-binding family 9-like protein, partial [Clostridia bacterium]